MTVYTDSDDLVPEPGKLDTYDEIQAEIVDLEKKFKVELKGLKEKFG